MVFYEYLMLVWCEEDGVEMEGVFVWKWCVGKWEDGVVFVYEGCGVGGEVEIVGVIGGGFVEECV